MSEHFADIVEEVLIKKNIFLTDVKFYFFNIYI